MKNLSAHHRDRADVLVLQHLHEDGPGVLGQWLDAQGVSWQVRCAQAGEAYPDSVSGYRALAVLGGAWSANDDRPTLRQAEALIREADALGLPVLGHCLGGQLLAKALGGRVATHHTPEIGWLPITHTGSASAREWLGEATDAVVYQWHSDSFVELPPGAELLASSSTCAHQAFALRQHLGMQFHIEITPAKIQDWLEEPGQAYPVNVLLHRNSVQDPASMNAATALYQSRSEAMAERIYRAWRARWFG
jgi:GMP synthase-like glutamine amidotransferase